jgi:hypothetical protein
VTVSGKGRSPDSEKENGSWAAALQKAAACEGGRYKRQIQRWAL